MMKAHDMMRRKGKTLLIAILIAAIGGLVSCGEDTPPAGKSQVVKKKIGGQQKKAETKTTSNETTGKEDKPDSAKTDKPKTVSKLVTESMAFSGNYNPKGRFDPFEPLLKDDPEKSIVTAKGRKRRVPQTPLERVAISQLKLSAIMRSNKGNSAIVEDSTGKGYVIRKGTYIGLNSGQVIRIDKSSVKIEEEIEDVSGEFRIQNIELKLQKPAGEL